MTTRNKLIHEGDKYIFTGEHVGNEVCYLSTKKGRAQWETAFCAKFLKTSLQVNHLMINSSKVEIKLMVNNFYTVCVFLSRYYISTV